MSGQIQRSSSVVIGANGPTANNSLSISPTTALQSPLQIFVRAKKRINDIYGEVEIYVNDSCKFLQCKTFYCISQWHLEMFNYNCLTALPKDSDLITKEELLVVDSHGEKVKGIREVLARDHMKVAFFGRYSFSLVVLNGLHFTDCAIFRTSNGKSTVINSMLRERILPSGIGHTTNCFIQVEGSENGESYLISEDSAEKKNVKSGDILILSLPVEIFIITKIYSFSVGSFVVHGFAW